MRIRLDVLYDGTRFHGWAVQPGLRTVEESLADALAMALRCETVDLTCAGRTDAGVHARGQVVHLDVEPDALTRSAGRATDAPTSALARRVNGILDSDVWVRRVSVVPDDFDARYSALWRRYAYRVADDSAQIDPLSRAFVLVWSRPLDLEAMNEAALSLTGLHDFVAFCRRRDGATTIRTLLDLRWRRDDAGRAVADVRADAFCHSMVRSLVGCLLEVGDGRRALDWPAQTLGRTVRAGDVEVAPARGLTLEQVVYPDPSEFTARGEITRATRIGAS